MKVDLRQEERTDTTPSDAIVVTPTDERSRWPFVATALVLVTLAIAAFVAMNGRTSPEQATQAVYLDPMTAARESGPYAQPEVGPWVDAMTGTREGGVYAQPEVGPWVDAMTGTREGGVYAPATGPWVDASTGAREGGGYAQPAPEPYADGMTGAREGGGYETTP